jgi:hypothetical protein
MKSNTDARTETKKVYTYLPRLNIEVHPFSPTMIIIITKTKGSIFIYISL